MSIISVFPGKGKAKLEAGSASPLTYAKTYTPSGDNEGFSEFKVNAMPSGTLSKPSIQQPNANGRVYATAGVSTKGYLSTSETEENYIDLSTRAEDTIIPGTAPKLAVSKGKFTTGDVYVAGSTSLLPGNIKKGENIFGVDGELVLGYDVYNFNVNASASGEFSMILLTDEVYAGIGEHLDILPTYMFVCQNGFSANGGIVDALLTRGDEGGDFVITEMSPVLAHGRSAAGSFSFLDATDLSSAWATDFFGNGFAIRSLIASGTSAQRNFIGSYNVTLVYPKE